MHLAHDSIQWSIRFLRRHSDGDIFPSIPELAAISQHPESLTKALSSTPLSELIPQPSRRFIVPKGELSYRVATQLHPQDSVVLTSLIHQYGARVEARRLAKDTVYSYRFSPDIEHGLYGNPRYWTDFWSRGRSAVSSYSHVLFCDIADFYNQIYHHTVENQLAESSVPKDAVDWICRLLGSTTAGVSRGVPIGPHAVHLVAECTLIPIDNSLRSHGLNFIRCADDLVVFCNSYDEAMSALRVVVTTLDKQQRLILQHYKTRIFESREFEHHCRRMLEDRPINAAEGRLLKVVRKHSDGNPYASITYNQISAEDQKEFSESTIDNIVNEYLASEETDFFRLKWFFRRLTQVGDPHALPVAIGNISKLRPCIAEICSYITSARSVDPIKWNGIGRQLLNLLEWPPITESEFLKLSIMSLFAKNRHMNHFEELARPFAQSDQHARREILLAARENVAKDWIREHKESYVNMDPWQKMAFVYCMSILPTDEKKHFLKRIRHSCAFEDSLLKWAIRFTLTARSAFTTPSSPGRSRVPSTG